MRVGVVLYGSGITWCSKVCGTAMGSGRVDCRYGACGMWSGDYMVSVF